MPLHDAIVPPIVQAIRRYQAVGLRDAEGVPWETSRSVLPADEQDATWAALMQRASTLGDLLEDDELEIMPVRRRARRVERDGLFVGNDWIDVFEPVRERQGGGDWTEVQTLDQAADAIAAFVRDRPDQAD